MKNGAQEVCLHTASRLGLADKLKAALESRVEEINNQDAQGKTPLHQAATANQEECVEILLEKGASVTLQDGNGNTALHCACEIGAPMICYQVATKGDGSLPLLKNVAGETPIDLAAATQRGEVLNALLLACSGQVGSDALSSMAQLLQQGAVCDTWAPNGSSALMLAAAIDCSQGVELLLANGATLELQDALGRTALMFAAGNDATSALCTLLEAGGSVSIRDRRGRNVMDYAGEGSAARGVLRAHLDELERKAAQLQAALLAEVSGDNGKAQGAGGKSKKAKKKKGSKPKKQCLVASRPEHAQHDRPAEAPAAQAAEHAAQATQACTQRAPGGVSDQPGAAAEAVMPSTGGAPGSAGCAEALGEGGARGGGQPGCGQVQESSGGEQPGAEQPGNDGGPQPADSCRRGSLDVDMGAAGATPSPPLSPGGWCVVGKHVRQHSKPVPVPSPPGGKHGVVHAAHPASVGGAYSTQRPERGRSQERQGRAVGRAGGSGGSCSRGSSSVAAGKGGRGDGGWCEAHRSGMHRSGSNGSMASTCSGESHDTDASRLTSCGSGSERSVLRPLLRRIPPSAGTAAAPLSGAAGGSKAVGTDPGSLAAARKAQQQPAARRSLLPPSAAWASSAPAAHAEQPDTPTWARVAEGGAGGAGGTGEGQVASCALLAAQAGEQGRPGQESAQQHGASARCEEGEAGSEAGGSTAAVASADGTRSSGGELSTLRDQVVQLQRAQQEGEARHRQELAAVLEDAARHEAAAVQQAVSAERMNCIVRFTSFLQNNAASLCSAFPELFRPGSCAPAPLPSHEAFLLGGDLSATLSSPPAAATPPLHIPTLGGCSTGLIPQGVPQLGSSAGGGTWQHPQQQQAVLDLCGGTGEGGVSPSDSSLLAGAANNWVGLAQSPPSALTSLPFSSLAFPSKFGAAQAAGRLDGEASVGSLLESGSPLPSSPFSFQDVESRLRGEFRGNHSAFVVPAAPEHPPSPSPFTASLLTSSLHRSLDTAI